MFGCFLAARQLRTDETITWTVRIDGELLGRDTAAALNADLKLDEGTITSIAVDNETTYTFVREIANRFKGIAPLVLDPEVSQKIVFDSQNRSAAVGDPRLCVLIIMPFMPRGEKIASVNKPNRTCPLLMVADVRMGGLQISLYDPRNQTKRVDPTVFRWMTNATRFVRTLAQRCAAREDELPETVYLSWSEAWFNGVDSLLLVGFDRATAARSQSGGLILCFVSYVILTTKTLSQDFDSHGDHHKTLGSELEAGVRLRCRTIRIPHPSRVRQRVLSPQDPHRKR